MKKKSLAWIIFLILFFILFFSLSKYTYGEENKIEWGPSISGVRMRVCFEEMSWNGKNELLPVIYIENNSGVTIYFEKGGGHIPDFGKASLCHYESNKRYIEKCKESNGLIKPSPFGYLEDGLENGKTLRLTMIDRLGYDTLRKEAPEDNMIALASFYTSKDKHWALWSNILTFNNTRQLNQANPTLPAPK